MLSSDIEAFTAPGTTRIAPRALAEELDISMSDLADLIGVGRSALYDSDNGPKVQKSLSKLTQILVAATDLAGSRRRAILWFKHNPIPGYRFKTPMELFASGQYETVRIIIENIRNGVYA
ncbi:MAG: DUF2384 domain-containing protein [Pseudomonadota bacterium]